MEEIISKEFIEKILGRKIFDYEYEFFYKALQAKREGKRLIFYPARISNKIRLKNEAKQLLQQQKKGIFYE